MKKSLLFVGFLVILTSNSVWGLVLYARVNGAWNSGTTWSTDGVTSCACTPTSIDDVFTNGFLISVPTGSFSVNNLFILSSQNGSLFKSSLGAATITIYGELGSYSGSIGFESLTLPAGPIITITRLNFTFNGTVPIGSSIIELGAWGPNAPLPNITYNPITPLTPLSIDSDISMGSGTSLTVSVGTLNVNGVLQSATTTASIIVSSGSTLVVNNGSIVGNSGTNSTLFPTLTITGTLASSSNTTSFINASTLTLNPNSVLNVGFNGSNQTQGWWYQSNAPATLNIDQACTVNYNSSTAQNVNAQTYGNLTLSGIGTLTKTVANSGSLNILGNLTFNNTGITLSVPSANQVIFNGSSSQSINGGGTANFNGGLQVNKTGTLTLSQNINVLNGLTLTSGTIDFGSNTVNLSGNLSNNATLTASASTLNITGTTSMSGSTTSLNNLTISGSGTLNAPATLNIGKDFTNNGTFNASTGNLIFNGGVAQSIGGTTASSFYDITSSSLSTVTVSTSQNITGILSVTSGIFNANGQLTLISTASGDAQIGAISGTVSGSVIVQRYLPNTSAVRAYRYLASPVTGATVADWKLSFPITGTFTDPSTQAEWLAISNLNSATPSMFVYNEPKGGVLGARYDTYPVNATATTSSALTNGTGYAAFVRQTAAIPLTVTGPIRQGNNVTVPVTNTNGNPADDGWNLIGNPFAAPINWDNVTLPAGLLSQISFKDNTGNITTAGNYVTFTQGSPGTGTPFGFAGTIPSGQAFWVRFTTAASSTNIVFKEADKQVIRNPKFVRQEAISNIIRAKLSGNGKDDELIIRFAENAKDELDQKFDAQKLRNDFLNFSSLSADNLKMAINGLSPTNCGTSAGRKEIPLLVEGFSSTTVLAPSAYKISFSQLETLDQQLKVVLKDSFNGDSLSVSLTSSTYQFNVTADAKSFGAKRFKLVITCPAIVTALPDEIIEKEIKIYPNPTNGSLQIQLPSELGTKVFVLNSIGEILGQVSMTYEGGYQKGQFELNDYSSGVYLVKIFNGNKVVTKKVIRK